MKVTTSLIAISALLLSLSSTSAKPISQPGPWAQIKNKDALNWTIYASPRGTNLLSAEPVEDRCKVYAPTNGYWAFETFKSGNFEFQQLDNDHVGWNCIDCTPMELGNLMATKIGNYLHCEVGDHRGADWKPKGGN